MSDRTICQMEVHPLLIKLHRERSELFKKWREIYGPNPFQPSQSPFGSDLSQSVFSALLGDIGATGISMARISPDVWRQP